MPSFSRIVQVGHVVHTPEIRDINGTPLARFSIATNYRYGEKEEACFIDVELWGKSAEVIEKYVKSGDPILVEGTLRQQHWEGKDGTKRSKHLIRADRFAFLPRTDKPAEQDKAEVRGPEAQTAATPSEEDLDLIPF